MSAREACACSSLPDASGSPLDIDLGEAPATRAGGLDELGREALLKYILRPAVAQERVPRGPDGLVRIGLKKASPTAPSPSTSIHSHC